MYFYKLRNLCSKTLCLSLRASFMQKGKSVGHGHVISLGFQHWFCTNLHSSALVLPYSLYLFKSFASLCMQKTLPKLSPVKQIFGLEPS